MSDIKIDKLQIDEDVYLSVYNDTISINIKGMNKPAFVNYTYELFEIIKSARFRVPVTQEQIENYKYPYSNEYRKGLHQIVFDHYFGEEVRKKAYDLDYISNLFILKKVKNTYKGWNFDKETQKALPIIGLKIYHVLSNKTFQITIAFNQTFENAESQMSLSRIKLLYDYNYEIVLQDAEQILESIINTGKVNFNNWRELYRYKDIKVDYSDDIEFTEEEKKHGCGMIVERNGKHYIILGTSQESTCFINSIPYEKDWDLKK